MVLAEIIKSAIELDQRMATITSNQSYLHSSCFDKYWHTNIKLLVILMKHFRATINAGMWYDLCWQQLDISRWA